MHPNAVLCKLSRCQTLAGVRKGDAKRGYTSSRGAIKTMGALINAVAGVAVSNLETPRGSESNDQSRLAMVDSCQALIYSNSGKISTVVDSWPPLMYIVKLRTFPSWGWHSHMRGSLIVTPRSPVCGDPVL